MGITAEGKWEVWRVWRFLNEYGMASLKASATWSSREREGKTNFSLSISGNKELLSLNVIVMLRIKLRGTCGTSEDGKR